MALELKATPQQDAGERHRRSSRAVIRDLRDQIGYLNFEKGALAKRVNEAFNAADTVSKKLKRAERAASLAEDRVARLQALLESRGNERGAVVDFPVGRR